MYFPGLEIPDPLNEFRPRNVAASGTMAGIYARTDATRGVWKAPAGTDGDLRGANVAVKLTDSENGALNPLGVNVLRKEGARFVAVGVEGGLLVLTVYEPAPEDRTSPRHASRSRVRRAGVPSRRNHPDPCASLFTLHNAPCKRLTHNTTAAPALRRL